MSLEKRPINIYYFSGTGNTLLIANRIATTFEDFGYEVVVRKIINGEIPKLEDNCHLGFIFPVAIQLTFSIVWNFIDKLPYGNGRKVFMADTMDEFSGGIRDKETG